MAKPTITVEGADELRRTLRQMQDKGLKDELKKANKSAAEVVVARALPNVPFRSGRLKKSVKALGSQRDGRVKAGNATNIDYAGAIHWGRKVGSVGWAPNNRMGANPITGRPFLYNAAQAAEDQVRDVYADRIDRLLDSIRGR